MLKQLPYYVSEWRVGGCLRIETSKSHGLIFRNRSCDVKWRKHLGHTICIEAVGLRMLNAALHV